MVLMTRDGMEHSSENVEKTCGESSAGNGDGSLGAPRQSPIAHRDTLHSLRSLFRRKVFVAYGILSPSWMVPKE